MQNQYNIENCWKRIGVWGQEERFHCPVLKEVIHCRNCNVFIQAGSTLLERALPQDYRNEWAEVLTQKKEEDLPGSISVVIFQVEREWLALPTHLFEEIIDGGRIHQLLHSIPHRNNPALMGVINIHGELWPCISFKELLGLGKDANKEKMRSGYKRLIVMNSDNGRWVFPVDGIHGIYHVHPRTFQNVPVTVARTKTTFTSEIFQWENKHVAFLDHERLFYSLTRSIT